MSGFMPSRDRIGGTSPAAAARIAARRVGKPKLAWPPMIAFAGVALITIVAIWPVPSVHDTAKVIATRQLRFIEQPGDRMAIIDAANNRPVGMVKSTADGFVPGVMYGMEVARRRFGVDLSAPYGLTQLSDGRVVLADVPTHSEVDLESFGDANAALFTALLHTDETHPVQETP